MFSRPACERPHTTIRGLPSHLGVAARTQRAHLFFDAHYRVGSRIENLESSASFSPMSGLCDLLLLSEVADRDSSSLSGAEIQRKGATPASVRCRVCVLFWRGSHRVAWRVREPEPEIALVALPATIWAEENQPMEEKLPGACATRPADVVACAVRANTRSKEREDGFHAPTFWTRDL
jgi:hypothetical protein